MAAELEWTGDDLPSSLDAFVRMEGPSTPTIGSNALIASAIYDFMGYLTTRVTPISVGMSEGCSPLLDRFQEWATMRGLNIEDPHVAPGVWELIPGNVPITHGDLSRRDDIILHMLDALHGNDRECLRQIVRELKQTDGEHWAVGELLERAEQYLDMQV